MSALLAETMAVDTDLPGACASKDPDLMFLADDVAARYGPKHPDVLAAKAVCGSCRIQASCLEGALERAEPWGIWGAMTTEERTDLRRTQHAADRRRRRALARVGGQEETLPGV